MTNEAIELKVPTSAQHDEWLIKHGHQPVTHKYLHQIQDLILNMIASVNDFATAMNEANVARNAKIVSLEAKVAELEVRPQMKYVGVWLPDTAYKAGNVSTVGGAMWYAHIDSKGVKPGTAPGIWQLCVKSGRDGRDR
jgi:hypothetical protein